MVTPCCGGTTRWGFYVGGLHAVTSFTWSIHPSIVLSNIPEIYIPRTMSDVQKRLGDNVSYCWEISWIKLDSTITADTVILYFCYFNML